MAIPDSDPVSEDGFFARWSRRKVEQRREDEPAGPTAVPPVAESPVSPALAEPDAAPAAVPAPTLQDVAMLTPGDEVSRFIQPGVDAGVQRAALKKLFADPRFNVMDGLDIYIDDYGKPDPIPPEMLRQMVQSKFLRLFDDEEEAAEQQPSALAPSIEVEPTAPVDDPATTTSDEDPDLQLQPDDPDRRPGAAERAG